ncbi:MAG: universal stress protein [Desulfobacterales bacterium]|jgi:nucleotide-binding universal stress UspA family protein
MVPEIKKILFATDLSSNSRHAFNYAVSAGDRYGASITILHVMEEVSPSANIHLKNFIGEEDWQKLQESHEQHVKQILIGKQKEGAMIRQALHEFCEQVKQDFTQCEIKTDDIVVTKGNAVVEIITETQNRGIDLIVMGYHSRGKLEEAVVGSTTRRVLRKSKIPVLLVRLPDDES